MWKVSKLIPVLLMSCAALSDKAFVVDETEGQIALGLFVGDRPAPDGPFQVKANELCPMGFVVTERSRDPVAVLDVDPDLFYWVVMCKTPDKVKKKIPKRVSKKKSKK